MEYSNLLWQCVHTKSKENMSVSLMVGSFMYTSFQYSTRRHFGIFSSISVPQMFVNQSYRQVEKQESRLCDWVCFLVSSCQWLSLLSGFCKCCKNCITWCEWPWALPGTASHFVCIWSEHTIKQLLLCIWFFPPISHLLWLCFVLSYEVLQKRKEQIWTEALDTMFTMWL